jgi:hypothetical protein
MGAQNDIILILPVFFLLVNIGLTKPAVCIKLQLSPNGSEAHIDNQKPKGNIMSEFYEIVITEKNAIGLNDQETWLRVIAAYYEQEASEQLTNESGGTENQKEKIEISKDYADYYDAILVHNRNRTFGLEDRDLWLRAVNNFYKRRGKSRIQDNSPAADRNEVFVSALSNDAIPDHLKPTLVKWRKMTDECFSYSGPIVWKVQAGFTLKRHAPYAGSYSRDLTHIQNWDFEDKPTVNSFVFWIPRIVPGSDGYLEAWKQSLLLNDLRERFYLPSNHLSSFGDISLLAGLMVAYFEMVGTSGTVLPYYGIPIRSCTCFWRWRIVCHFETGLYCVVRDQRSDNPDGIFALGIEPSDI